VTKEEIKNAILACAKKLGYTPNEREVMKHGGVSRGDLRRYFGAYRKALEECGMEGSRCGRLLEMEDLFRDWAMVARTLKKIPTIYEFEELSKYSPQPLRDRLGRWSQIPEGMKSYAEAMGLTEEYKDVMELVGQAAGRQGRKPMTSRLPAKPKAIAGRPVYGPLIAGWPLVFAPTNEAGVLFLFGAMAASLGFLALRIQTEYPDCEAMRVVGENQLQRVKIELEHQSRNFLRHLHDPSKCDLIVCWEHNWPECPLEVIELKSHLPKLPELPKSPGSEDPNPTTDGHGQD
jgi:HNH endonuclease